MNLEQTNLNQIDNKPKEYVKREFNVHPVRIKDLENPLDKNGKIVTRLYPAGSLKWKKEFKDLQIEHAFLEEKKPLSPHEIALLKKEEELSAKEAALIEKESKMVETNNELSSKIKELEDRLKKMK